MVTEARRYQVLGAIGRGGFGTVYRADMLGEGGFAKRVALKVLNADMDEVAEMASRLRDEARMLGLLRHRAIVQVDGLVRLDGRWTIVMEYVEGVDLKELVGGVGPVPLGPALQIVAETAAALHVAWTRPGPDGTPLHLLHRDIKPSNIQLTAAGETKLLDFGVARADFAAREAQTRSLVFGSIGYMAPERLDFIDGPEGDVYALGVVLYELLGAEAFGKTSSNEDRHQRRVDAALGRLVDVPQAVLECLREVLAYDAAKRPTAREFERRCHDLRHRFAMDPRVEEWAEEVVPGLLAARTDLPDDLAGATLVEQSSGVDTLARERSRGAGDSSGGRPVSGPASTSGARPATGAGAVSGSVGTSSGAVSGSRSVGVSADARVGGVLAAIVALGVGGAGVGLLLAGAGWWFGRSEAPERTVGAETAAMEAQAGAEAVAVTTVAAEVPTAEDAPMPVTSKPAVGAKPASAAKPAAVVPETPTPALSAEVVDGPAQAVPEPQAAPQGKVVVTGDATEVVLIGPGGRSGPGAVAPGSYKIEASFGGALVPAGQIQVVGGTTVTVDCQAAFVRCRGR